MSPLRRAPAVLAAALLVAPALHAQDGRPLAAIDWLNEFPSVEMAPPGGEARTGEPPVADTADPPDVTVTELDSPGAGGVGLLPASVTGFPPSLWQGSDPETLSRLVRELEVEGLPALQSLLYTLLLAEALPPGDANGGEELLLTRIDRLRALGAVEPAEALVDRAGTDGSDLFERWFDLALLSGRQDEACRRLIERPHLMEAYAPRIYCQALGGDWMVAAMTLENASALGDIDPQDAHLLMRFLDPEAASDLPPMAPPPRPTPLQFRMLEAVGEPPPSSLLPRAFANIDLAGDAGWKAQIEAAERLARVGALSENRLIGIYTERRPAASGGVWDRVAAVQRFDRALDSGAPEPLATALAEVWPAMRGAGLAVPFAQLYGGPLLEADLAGSAAEQAREVAFLSPEYEAAATAFDGPSGTLARFLASVATGSPDENLARSGLAQAVTEAFSGAEVPPDARRRLDEGRLGESILIAMAQVAQGAEGDLRGLADALATFRAVGLEDSARRAALQLLLLKEDA